MSETILTAEAHDAAVAPVNNQGQPQRVLMTESEQALQTWQNRTLRVMQAMLVFVTVLFFVSGWIQLRYLQNSILNGSTSPFTDTTSTAELVSAPDDAALNASILLESYVLERRYHQANTLLMSMVWIRYLGFSTGMVIALVGAAFILGKLREDPFNLNVEGDKRKLSLSGTSPGLIMVFLGVVLMMTTIVRQHTFSITDQPVYFSTSQPLDNLPLPPTLPVYSEE